MFVCKFCLIQAFAKRIFQAAEWSNDNIFTLLSEYLDLLFEHINMFTCTQENAHIVFVLRA